jgi:hypothetical protein
MRRSIRRLRIGYEPAAIGEVRAAALRCVRKISGPHRAPIIDGGSFDDAIDAIAAASQRLLDSLGPVAARR